MRDDDTATPAQPSAETASVGSLLREAREAQQFSLLQISEALRIEPQLLEALEQDRFDAVGAPVFVKGYLKNYAECIGLDPRPLLETYRKQRGDEQPVLQARRSIGHQPVRPVGTWVVAAAAVVSIGAFLWLRSGGDESSSVAQVDEASVTPAASSDASLPEPATDAAPRAATAASFASSPPPGGELPQAAAEPSAAVTDEPALPLSPDVATADTPPAEPPGESAGPAELPVGSDGSPTAGSATAAPAPSPPAPSSDAGEPGVDAGLARALAEINVALRFIEDSWAEVTGPGDERLYYGLGRAGAEARINAPPPIDVLLGNADGVAVEVDGEPFSYPANSRSGNLAQFTLTAAAE